MWDNGIWLGRNRLFMLKVAGIIFVEYDNDGMDEARYLFGLKPPIATISAIEVN